jgi:preprotein translocase subunit YajC
MTSQGLGSFLPLIFMLAAAWFLLIRPQQKKAKQQSEMLSRLEAGAEIVTIGGIYGTIVDLGEERVRIAVADGSELEIARQAIRTVVTPAEETPELEDASELDEADGSDDLEPPVADEDEGEA